MKKLVTLMMVMVMAFALASCGGGSGSGSDLPEAGVYPMTLTDGIGNTVTIEEEPDKIASLSPSCTEILYELDLKEKIAGVSTWCTYPEETAKVLRDGWLYTGDMGYIDSDGSLRIVGRKGNIIAASKGKQIYPEELEARLERSQYVRECVVMGVPNDSTGEYDTVAVIYPERSKFVEQYGEGYTDATVLRELEEAVDAVNDRFDGTHKRISRFTVKDTEFEKTADGKIIRSFVRI